MRGVPARVLPLDVWHTASIGIELWLSAIAFGASQVWVLMTDEEAPDYRVAVAAQMAVAEEILHGLGLDGEHFRIVDAAAVVNGRVILNRGAGNDGIAGIDINAAALVIRTPTAGRSPTVISPRRESR